MSALSLDILGPGLVAGLVILATHVPLGATALGRFSMLTGLAVAQAAALGIVVGNAMLASTGAWAIQGAAIVTALGCATLLDWTDQRFHAVQEAVAAFVYVAAAAVTLAFLAGASDGLEQLTGLLVGDILQVSPMQLFVMGVVYAGVLATWYLRDLFAERALFSAMLAITLAVSVQAAGVFLAFAMLIIPALAARRAPARWRLVVAFNIGAAGYLAGLVALALWASLTGAVIIGSLVVAGLVGAKLLAPRPKAANLTEMANVKSLQDEIQARMTKTKVA